jgi:AbrB family looped-hinge helix DNA binding protein
MGTRVTTKGQVTIPKAIRDELGIKPGDELEFVRVNGSIRVVRAEGDDPFAQWRGACKWVKERGSAEIFREMRGR